MGVTELMSQHSYLICAVALILAAALVGYLVHSRRRSEPRKRSWVDYLLLWPLILDADADERAGQFLTKREWFGWAAFALLVACAIAFS